MAYNEFLKRTLTVFGIAVLLLALWHLRSVVMLGFLSAIIAISLSIPVKRLQSWGLNRGGAIGVTLLSTLIVLLLFFGWLMPVIVLQMVDLVTELPSAVEAAAETYEEWRVAQTEPIQEMLPSGDIQEIQDTLGIEEEGQQLFTVEDITNFVFPVLRGAGNFAFGLLANLVIIIVVSIFLLIDPMDYAKGAIMLFPRPYHKRALEVMLELRDTLTQWMSALALSMTATFVLVIVILGGVFNVPNSAAIALIAAISTIIPNIGVVIPMVPITIFTLAGNNPGQLPLVLVTYYAIQQVEGNVITPSIVKQTLNIPAGLIFLFQIISAAVFGAIGIILAVPLLATIITLVRELYVYDGLGLRGIQVDLEQTNDGNLRLISRAVEEHRALEIYLASEGDELEPSPD